MYKSRGYPWGMTDAGHNLMRIGHGGQSAYRRSLCGGFVRENKRSTGNLILPAGERSPAIAEKDEDDGHPLCGVHMICNLVRCWMLSVRGDDRPLQPGDVPADRVLVTP